MQRKLLTGMVIGAAATMLFLPDMNKGTKRRIKRANRYMKNAAGDIYDNMMRRMR
ncbi:gas vesicle protein [Clostridium tetanomorphum]|uniref:YtxH domain-containing protein n=1 Tax=Clostridium tetanomorphum TaxID=1553 RepID=A0A923E638_CLOTT|nr:YtxH domain-containing protein [Clostridium tetanomorphum]KAJ50888.1 hypothetical protein CTM_15633 [Clostridium tetanomorphum DSM 665]MBC2397140.1 YtxH domain-containing protein [Clostridium tetanomorphum]MBP1863062.1 gas vesicle protein [Clostridium tetanomorphum]NRS82891.1 gas vesicle protein [Clostridium tetanomorphum]NRZ99013.1 gas vesicle protein [Clostridium tetanomorphum]